MLLRNQESPKWLLLRYISNIWLHWYINIINIVVDKSLKICLGTLCVYMYIFLDQICNYWLDCVIFFLLESNYVILCIILRLAYWTFFCRLQQKYKGYSVLFCFFSFDKNLRMFLFSNYMSYFTLTVSSELSVNICSTKISKPNYYYCLDYLGLACITNIYILLHSFWFLFFI